MSPTESGEEVIQRDRIGYIEHCQSSLNFVPVGVQEIVDADAGVENSRAMRIDPLRALRQE